MIPRQLTLSFTFATEAAAFRARMEQMFGGAYGWSSQMLDARRVRLSGLMAGEALAMAREAGEYGGQAEVDQPKEETHV